LSIGVEHGKRQRPWNDSLPTTKLEPASPFSCAKALDNVNHLEPTEPEDETALHFLSGDALVDRYA